LLQIFSKKSLLSGNIFLEPNKNVNNHQYHLSTNENSTLIFYCWNKSCLVDTD